MRLMSNTSPTRKVSPHLDFGKIVDRIPSNKTTPERQDAHLIMARDNQTRQCGHSQDVDNQGGEPDEAREILGCLFV